MKVSVPDGTQEPELNAISLSADQPQKTLTQQQRHCLIALAEQVTGVMPDLPLDIEWSIADDQVFLLQVRPLLGLPEPVKTPWMVPIPGTLWCRTWRLGEWLSGPVTPLFETWGLPILAASRETFGTGQLGWDHLPTFSMPEPWFCISNGYFFTRHELPKNSGAGMGLSDRLERLRALRDHLSIWQREKLPAYLQHFSRRESIDIEGHTAQELMSLVDTLLAEAGEFWYLIAPVGYGFEALVFKPIYESCLKNTDAPHYSLLFRGFPARAIDGQQVLFDLYRKILAEPLLTERFRDLSLPSLACEIDRMPAWVRQELEHYRETYGHQVQSLDFFHPTLGEVWETPLSTLQAMFRFGGKEPLVALAEVRREREQAQACVLDQLLADHPQKAFMAELIACFQMQAAIREDAIFYFQKGWPTMRRALTLLGQRFCEIGLLKRADQMFFLSLEEVRSAALAWDSVSQAEPMHERAERRRALWEQQCRMKPPDFLPPEATHQQVRVKTGFVLDEHGARLLGLGVSCGKAAGQVRVVHSCQTVKTFNRGDILVVKTASPSLTPLMLLAGGLVVDSGGGASHSSLVARELGLPTVVNTRCAMEHVREGQMLEVDGSSGIVYLRDSV